MVLIISCLHKLYVFPSWKIHVLCILIPSRYITFFLDTTPIHRAYFLTFLFARYLCQSIEVFFDTFLNTSHRSSSSCMLFMCESCFAFFFSSLYVHSILFSCFSGRSMFPCSPYSFYASFLFVSSHVFFWLFLPFDNHVKNGEKFEFWMLFLRGSNRFRGRTSC